MRHRYRYMLFPKRTYELNIAKDHPSLKAHEHGRLFTLDLYRENEDDLELISKLGHLRPAIIKEYTQNELDAAPWLRITPCWSDFFPYPEENYRQTVYGASDECPCGAAITQIKDFCIDSEIKKMKKPFLQLNWVYDEIFISNQVQEVLLNSALRGYGFRNVWIRETGKTQSNIAQLTVDTMIPPVFAFSKMEIEQEDICRCGTPRRFLKQGSPLVFKQSVIRQICDVDIFKTSESFGRGSIWSHMVFISHEFYRVLRHHHLDDSLMLELPEYTD